MLNDKELEAIRQKMHAHEETPPPAAWGKIQQDIQHKPWWKRMPFWWSAGLIGILLSVVIISDITSEEEVKQSLAQTSSEKIGKQESQDNPDVQEEKLKLPIVQSDSSNSQKRPMHISESSVVQGQNLLAEVKNVFRNESRTEVGIAESEETNTLLQRQVQDNQIREVSRQKPQMNTSATAAKRSVISLATLDEGPVEEEVVVRLSEEAFISEEVKNTIIPAGDGKGGANYLGIHFTPQYTYRFIAPIADDEIYVTNIKSSSQSALERRGYSVGVQYGKSITENILLEGGLSWLSLRQELMYQYNSGEVDTLIYNLQEDGRVILQPTLTERERTLSSQYAYGSLQLGIHYFFWQNQQRRFNLYLGGGMNLLVKGKTEEYEDGALIKITHFPSKDNPLEQSNYHLQIGAGYNRKLARRYELNIMPSLSYFLGSTYREREPLGIRSYTVGLKFQLRRYFASNPS